MKIRQGFVSNSSSSSFLLYGLECDWEDIEKKLGGNDEDTSYEVAMEALERLGLDTHQDGDNLYIGRFFGFAYTDSVNKTQIVEIPSEEDKRHLVLCLKRAGVKCKKEDLKLYYGEGEF
jgi:hypothetical protein